MPEKLQVYKTPCKNCLYSDKAIVSPERVADITKECLETDTYFICHISSQEGGSTCCNRFFHRYSKDVLITRAAIAFNQVVFTPMPETEALIPYRLQG